MHAHTCTCTCAPSPHSPSLWVLPQISCGGDESLSSAGVPSFPHYGQMEDQSLGLPSPSLPSWGRAVGVVPPRHRVSPTCLSCQVLLYRYQHMGARPVQWSRPGGPGHPIFMSDSTFNTRQPDTATCHCGCAVAASHTVRSCS